MQLDQVDELWSRSLQAASHKPISFRLMMIGENHRLLGVVAATPDDLDHG